MSMKSEGDENKEHLHGRKFMALNINPEDNCYNISTTQASP